MRKFYPILASVFLALFFLAFMGLPLFSVVEQGLNFGGVKDILAGKAEGNPFTVAFVYINEAFKDPIYREGLWNAFRLGVTATILVFLISVPLALIFDRYEFPLKKYVNVAMLLPLILPPFVGALGLEAILGQMGALNALLMTFGIITETTRPDWLGSMDGRFWAVCIIEALHLYPILYLNTVTALANVDPTMEEAARNLGGGRWTRFRKVTLPLIRPGLFAGGSIVFVWSFTELGTPLMLNFRRVTTVQIFDGLKELETSATPYALVVILLSVSALLYILSRWLFGEDADASTLKGMAGSHAKQLKGPVAWLPVLAFLFIVVISAVPHIGMTLKSFEQAWYDAILPQAYTTTHYVDAWHNQYVLPSIANSLKFSLLAVLVSCTVGILLGLLTVRWKPPGWQVFDVLSMMPLAIPGLVLAFGYLSMGTRYAFLSKWANPVENPSILLVLAYAMRRLPYVARAVSAGLQQTPAELELAAKNLGAGSLRTLAKITVPLILANIIVGALFAFSFSMLEVSDSLILAQKEQFYPITRAIYELYNILGSGANIACAFGVAAMLFLAFSLFLANLLLGRKMGALFRF